MVFGNLHLVDEAEHVGVDGGRYLIIHGDQYDVITRYHRWIAFLGDISYVFLLRMNRVVNWARKRLGYGHWSLAKYLKHKVKRAVNFISEFEEALATQCRRMGHDGVVCGHIHHAEITQYGEINYMNCGDWVESCTALVERQDGQFEILRWGQVDAPVVALSREAAVDTDTPVSHKEVDLEPAANEPARRRSA